MVEELFSADNNDDDTLTTGEAFDAVLKKVLEENRVNSLADLDEEGEEDLRAPCCQNV